MLVIRNDQMQAMDEFAVRKFETELVGHIKTFAPKHSEIIEDKGVRKVVRLGMERAKERYGFTYRGSLRFYVEMMFMFGSDFDTDFQMPWTAEALNTGDADDQMARADLLYDKMLEYLEKVSGPKDEYALEAMRRLNRERAEDYQVSRDNFKSQVVSGLHRIYPQKAEYLGEPLINELIKRANVLAGNYSITSKEGVALFIALMFGLGHGFATDPLFPWISTTLQDESIADPNDKAERLRMKMKVYLDRALKYLEEKRKNV